MHERLCTHAESVAFFGGGAREKAVSILTKANIECIFFKCVHFWGHVMKLNAYHNNNVEETRCQSAIQSLDTFVVWKSLESIFTLSKAIKGSWVITLSGVVVSGTTNLSTLS